MVNTRQLIEPDDNILAAFPDLYFQNRRSFVTNGEAVLLVDPTYIADVYNSKDEIATFLRDRGLFLIEFGGDTAVPVWWKDPFLVLPISMHRDGLAVPPGAVVLTKEIGCDSGSFVFLPLSIEIPNDVQKAVNKVLEQNVAVELQLPPGHWKVFYEQFDAPQPNMVGHYRDIVLMHSPVSPRSPVNPLLS